MSLNRRAFLGSLLTAASAFAVDPERVLWMPEAKTIFVPQLKHYTFEDWVSIDALRLLKNQLVFTSTVNARFVTSTINAGVAEDFKVGDMIHLKYPARVQAS